MQERKSTLSQDMSPFVTAQSLQLAAEWSFLFCLGSKTSEGCAFRSNFFGTLMEVQQGEMGFQTLSSRIGKWKPDPKMGGTL